jgi:hypothetical protein
MSKNCSYLDIDCKYYLDIDCKYFYHTCDKYHEPLQYYPSFGKPEPVPLSICKISKITKKQWIERKVKRL